MVYIVTPRASSGARELAAALTKLGVPAKRAKSLTNTGSGDLIVNWGCGGLDGYKSILNHHIVLNKYTQLVRMAEKHVPVPPHSQVRKAGWLARRYKHQEANDLLANLAVGDYYVEYVPTKYEFRVHVWRGRSIRAGTKVPRTEHPHPKFRSWTAGWKLDYGTICQDRINNAVRTAAKAATEALGQDFGAVDVGITEKGGVVVFEVNSAPGLEGHTIEAYAKAIQGEIKGGR